MNSKEIAKLAGVSRSTVSRVINNYPDISKETREHVLKIIAENNYYPNISAQKLAGGSTKIIGLLIYTGEKLKNQNHKKVSESFYYSKLLTEIVDEAELLGYSVLVSYIHNNNWEKIFSNGTIDGAIVITGGKKVEEVNSLISKNYKIVLIDYEEYISNKNTSTINHDNFYGGFKATEYLIKNNRKNTLHITGDINRKMSMSRASGYLEALKKSKIINYKIINGEYTEKSGYDIVINNICENKKFDFNGVFAGNDYIALGVIKALKESNIKVPEEVSVIGYDNLLFCDYTTPKITSIKHLNDNVANNSLNKLIRLINGENGEKEMNEISIVERESVLKI